VNFLSTYSDKKSAAIPQQLYKPASRGLSAIAELLVVPSNSLRTWTVCIKMSGSLKLNGRGMNKKVQLLQTDRAVDRVTEYFAKSLKVMVPFESLGTVSYSHS